MAKVFVSYRNNDDPSTAVLLAEAIDQKFGEGTAFFDSKSIPLGSDFRPILWGQLAKCVAMVVVVGPKWLLRDGERGRRIDREDDFVRQEIEFALQIGIGVIPVLVGGAVRLKAGELPASLSALADRQYLTLRHRSIDQDLARLFRGLREFMVSESPGVKVEASSSGPTSTGITFNGAVQVGG
ncbi:toll/interleukin-1 receptor domain-containing protein, partial [Micromonospora sp. M61]|uniref:toll/interleukin-1 receptor domain-containing protein n=1 Tax=Micromonospora sp. M61 TaxID=2824890 RepID=UPI001B395A31